jgi:hypothetical protein
MNRSINKTKSIHEKNEKDQINFNTISIKPNCERHVRANYSVTQ